MIFISGTGVQRQKQQAKLAVSIVKHVEHGFGILPASCDVFLNPARDRWCVMFGLLDVSDGSSPFHILSEQFSTLRFHKPQAVCVYKLKVTDEYPSAYNWECRMKQQENLLELKSQGLGRPSDDDPPRSVRQRMEQPPRPPSERVRPNAPRAGDGRAAWTAAGAVAGAAVATGTDAGAAASARPAASAAPSDSPARPARPAAVPDTGGNGQRDRDPPGHNNGVDTDILIGLFDDQRDMLEVSCHPL